MRLAVYGVRAIGGLRRVLAVDLLLLYALGLLVIGATAITTAETGAPGATIQTFPDALWWDVVTMTTVGYGDTAPVTPIGRMIAFGLMLGGIAIFGALTANLASWPVRADQTGNVQAELLAEVTALRADLARLERRLTQPRSIPYPNEARRMANYCKGPWDTQSEELMDITAILGNAYDDLALAATLGRTSALHRSRGYEVIRLIYRTAEDVEMRAMAAHALRHFGQAEEVENHSEHFLRCGDQHVVNGQGRALMLTGSAEELRRAQVAAQRQNTHTA